MTVIDGATYAAVAVATGTVPAAVAVNPATNRIYVANAGSNDVTVINGATNTTITIPAGTAPGAVAVNPATNKIYVANGNSNDVTVIDGATNLTTTVAAGALPMAVAVNPVTHQIYVPNFNGNNVTVITPGRREAIPLAVVIEPFPNHTAIDPSPLFSFSAASTFLPVAPSPRHIYFQVDTWTGPWQKAELRYSDGAVAAGQGFAAPLQPGLHIVYVFAVDGQDATSTITGRQSSPLIGTISAYVFLVKPQAPPGGGRPDAEPPACRIVQVSSGPPGFVEVEVQDEQSGIASIEVLRDVNLTVEVPEFDPGTRELLIVRGTKIDNAARASLVLRATDMAGNETTCDPVIATLVAEAPSHFELGQNYPNPFNPSTSFALLLPESGHVTLTVYDVSGRLVTTLFNRHMDAGTYRIEWDGTGESGILPSGVYFYHVTAAEYRAVRKMTLIR